MNALLIEMTDKWKAAFKQIYGTTPTKSDYKMAPDHIKEVYYGHSPPSPPTLQTSKSSVDRNIGVRLKRPADDQYSPLKRPRKKTRTETSIPYFCSPKEKVSLSPLKGLHPIHLPIQTPSRIAEVEAPNKQTMDSSLSQTSLFDTPDKDRNLWESSPLKRLDVKIFPSTPIRSPKKPVAKCITMRNVSTLLLPTPEKHKEEPMEPFINEECILTKGKRNTKKSVGSVDSVFPVETGRPIKRAFKRPIPSEQKSAKTKKLDGNFVRINMKKKSFVRGKLSAEQKRKMRRKQNWNKRFKSVTK